MPGTSEDSVAGEKIQIKTVTPIKVQSPKTEKAGEKGEGYSIGKGEQNDDGTGEGRPLKKPKNLLPIQIQNLNQNLNLIHLLKKGKTLL